MEYHMDSRKQKVNMGNSDSNHSQSEEMEGNIKLKPVEMASILFCLHLKFEQKRDINFVKASRCTSKKTFSVMSDLLSKQLDADIHLVGSVAEGINGPNSDTDYMICMRNSYCCEANLSRTETAAKKVLLADCFNASPGYVLLWNADMFIRDNIRSWNPLKLNRSIDDNSLLSIINITDGIKVKTVARFGTMVLDNLELCEELLPPNITRTGPAFNCIYGFSQATTPILSLMKLDVGENIKNLNKLLDTCLGKMNTDQVYALPLHCKGILEKYINRRRRFEWPPKPLLKEIENIPTYVVPVGRKGSPFERKEWRISFTLTETHLIKSLNEVQLMLLYQLKLVAKDCLVPICPDISSYVIKNLILWMVECSPAEFFQYKKFIPLYKSALSILRIRISDENMPNYMIPKRNLLEGKLSIFTKWKLKRRLNSLLKEGLNICTLNKIYKTVSCQEIDLLKEQIETERQTKIRSVFQTTEISKYLFQLSNFISPITLVSRLIEYSNTVVPKIPADIPLD